MPEGLFEGMLEDAGKWSSSLSLHCYVAVAIQEKGGGGREVRVPLKKRIVFWISFPISRCQKDRSPSP